MLTRIHGLIVFICDDCNDHLETETDDWDDAITQFRTERWHSSKDDETGTWSHQCADCDKIFRDVGRKAAQRITRGGRAR
jgi:hypothetical protein